MIKKISWQEIIDLLQSAQKRLILVMPAVHQEWIEVIKRNNHLSHLDIKVCIDNSEAVIRNGYGSIEAIEALKAIGAIIMECEGLRISFICSDDKSYCLFLESRMLVGDPEGYNAIELDSAIAENMIGEFFPKAPTLFPVDNKEVMTKPLNDTTLAAVKESLDKNPPEQADLRRKITVYNQHFQFVELHFEGGNLSAKTIAVPSSILPYKDEAFRKRLKAKLNLFPKGTTEKWKDLTKFKTKLENLRTDFLVPCSLRKDKSILRKHQKADFTKAVNALIKESTEIADKLWNDVQTAIFASEDQMKKELLDFFKANPPDSVKGLDEEKKQNELEYEIKLLLRQIKLPDASSLLENIKIKVFYYDLTWEDLKDQNFLRWFEKKGLIGGAVEKELAEFTEAFGVKGKEKVIF